MSEIEPYHDDDEPQWASDPKQMGFLDHLEELRWTLLKPLILFFAGFITAMVRIVDVKDFLVGPLYAVYESRPEAEKDLVLGGLVSYDVTGVFIAMLMMGLISGLIVASPVFIYYIGKFLAPALTKRERRILVPGSFAVLFLFLAGAAFGYYFLLPRTIEAVLWVNDLLGLIQLWSVSSYLGYLSFTILGLGIAFQMPLLIVILVTVGIVTPAQLRKYRRYFILGIIVLAAILTPPEPITQIALAGPLLILYEISIIVSIFLKKKHDAKVEAEWADDD